MVTIALERKTLCQKLNKTIQLHEKNLLNSVTGKLKLWKNKDFSPNNLLLSVRDNTIIKTAFRMIKIEIFVNFNFNEF